MVPVPHFPHNPQDDCGNDDDANDGRKIHSSSHLLPDLVCEIWQITNASCFLFTTGQRWLKAWHRQALSLSCYRSKEPGVQ